MGDRIHAEMTPMVLIVVKEVALGFAEGWVTTGKVPVHGTGLLSQRRLRSPLVT